MKETDCVKKAHLVICEGQDDYRVCGNEEEAKDYARSMALKKPDTHWLVFSPVCGFID